MGNKAKPRTSAGIRTVICTLKQLRSGFERNTECRPYIRFQVLLLTEALVKILEASIAGERA